MISSEPRMAPDPYFQIVIYYSKISFQIASECTCAMLRPCFNMFSFDKQWSIVKHKKQLFSYCFKYRNYAPFSVLVFNHLSIDILKNMNYLFLCSSKISFQKLSECTIYRLCFQHFQGRWASVSPSSHPLP